MPSARVYHHPAASSGSVSPLLARRVERNRVWVAVKNVPVWLLVYGAIVLGGVTVGDGTVVADDLPEGAVAVGVPAQVLRER